MRCFICFIFYSFTVCLQTHTKLVFEQEYAPQRARGYQKKLHLDTTAQFGGNIAHAPAAAAAKNMKFVLAVHGRNLNVAEKHYSENSKNQST